MDILIDFLFGVDDPNVHKAIVPLAACFLNTTKTLTVTHTIDLSMV